MTTPIFIGSQSKTAVGSTSSGLTFDLTALTGGDLGDSPSLQEGDLVIVIVGFGSNTNVNCDMVTSGYTQRQDSYISDTYDANIGIFYKFMGATPDTSAETADPNSTAFAQAGRVYVFRRIDPDTPFDVADQSDSGINTILFDPPSVTPSTENAIIIYGAIGGHNDGGTGNLWRQNASGDQLEDFATTARNDTYDVLFASGFKRWSSGAFNPGQWTYDGSDSTQWSYYGYAITLRPWVHGLDATDIQSAAEVDSPAVGQEHALAATSIESASEVDNPAVTEVVPLDATDVQSLSEVSAPAVGQEHALTQGGVESAPEVSSPSLGQEHALTATDVESAGEVDSPSVGQVHDLDPTDIESASEVDSSSLGQEHALLAEDVESASEVGSPGEFEIDIVLAALGSRTIELGSLPSRTVVVPAQDSRTITLGSLGTRTLSVPNAASRTIELAALGNRTITLAAVERSVSS